MLLINDTENENETDTDNDNVSVCDNENETDIFCSSGTFQRFQHLSTLKMKKEGDGASRRHTHTLRNKQELYFSGKSG